MKKILFISIFSFLISFKIAAADENKCSNFKVFTPEHNKCVKNKTKKITDFGKKSLKKLNLNTDSQLTDWLKKKTK